MHLCEHTEGTNLPTHACDFHLFSTNLELRTKQNIKNNLYFMVWEEYMLCLGWLCMHQMNQKVRERKKWKWTRQNNLFSIRKGLTQIKCQGAQTPRGSNTEGDGKNKHPRRLVSETQTEPVGASNVNVDMTPTVIKFAVFISICSFFLTLKIFWFEVTNQRPLSVLSQAVMRHAEQHNLILKLNIIVCIVRGWF